MLKKLDIHNWEKRIKASIIKIKNSDLSDRNKEIILEFTNDLYTQNLSKARIMKYLEVLYLIAKRYIDNKNFDKLEEKDLKRFVAIINQRECSGYTKQQYRVAIKKLMMWFNGGEVPEKIKWLRAHIKKSEKPLPGGGEYLTQEDVNTIIATATSLRDKCLVSMLYESGCRIGEIASIRIGNVEFDKYGVVITVIGKTGSRKLRLVNSSSYMKSYMDYHPNKDNLESELWINIGTRNHGKPMMYGAFREKVKRLCIKAGIKKKCNLHMFRHSRATFMANHLTEFQMNQYFGWAQGSDMPATYVHLSGRDLDGAILNLNGIAHETMNKPTDTAKQCPRCEFINPHTTKLCNRCSHILDSEIAVLHQQDERNKMLMGMVMKELIKEPSIKAHIEQRLGELGIKGNLLQLN